MALLAFYNIIFTTRRFRLAAFTLMGVCIAYAIAFIPVFMTNCRPLEASWNPALGHCKPVKRQEFASVSINMVIDLAIVLLPLPTIWTLQMRLKKKVFISFMFSLGFLYVIPSHRTRLHMHTEFGG